MPLTNYSLPDNCNLIAQVASVYHLLGTLAYAYEASKNEKINAVVFVTRNWNTNSPITETEYGADNLHISIIKLQSETYSESSNFQSILNYLIKRKNNEYLHILTVMSPNINLLSHLCEITGKRFKLISIDEGSGTYYKGYSVSHKTKRGFKKLLAKLLFVYDNFSVLNPGDLSYNDRVIKCYKNFIDDLADNFYGYKFEKLSTDIKKVIIASSPYIDTEYFQDFYTDLLSILKSNGYTPLIKPHPSEGKKFFEFFEGKAELLPVEVPFEVMAGKLNPEFVIGVLSTTSINSVVFYNIPSVDISRVFRAYYLKRMETGDIKYNLNEDINQLRKFMMEGEMEIIIKQFRTFWSVLNTFDELDSYCKFKR